MLAGERNWRGHHVVRRSFRDRVGAVSLERPAMNVWAGLAYESRVRTLRLDVLGGTFWPGRTRRVTHVYLRLHQSSGGEATIAGSGKPEPLLRREATDPMDAAPPLRSGDVAILPASDFDPATRIEIRQAQALPLDILSLSVTVSVGEAAA
jgi:hypothetical protein